MSALHCSATLQPEIHLWAGSRVNLTESWAVHLQGSVPFQQLWSSASNARGGVRSDTLRSDLHTGEVSLYHHEADPPNPSSRKRDWRRALQHPALGPALERRIIRKLLFCSSMPVVFFTPFTACFVLMSRH